MVLRHEVAGAAASVMPGVVFHGLRHHHKTILDEIDVPEVIKCERMGHQMKGIQGVYSLWGAETG